jgi:hypothetical protein
MLPEGISTIDEIIEISQTHEERIDLLSTFMQQKVSHTLFLIDDAISAWEAAGRKPARIKRRMVILSEFQKSFTKWEKLSLLSRNKNIKEREKVLKDFIELCAMFEDKLESVGG